MFLLLSTVCYILKHHFLNNFHGSDEHKNKFLANDAKFRGSQDILKNPTAN